MTRRDLEQKLAGAITDELKKAGKSLWKKIVGPSDEDRLNTITSKFISEAREEKHSTTEIEEILLSVPDHILGNANSDTIASIDKTAFSPKNLYRACHVGSVILNPRTLYAALHGLWRYAKIKNHESDGLFGTDGRAHLILAITAMTGKVFSINDPDKKESWLNLLNIFLSETMKSDLVKSKNWSDETFFKVLNHLKNTIKESIKDFKRDRTKHDVRLYLDVIAEKTEACREYMRTVLPMLYENESSVIIDGRPKVKDLDGTFIACLLDVAGFVLPEDKDYLDQVIEEVQIKDDKCQSQKIENQEHIEGTKKFITIIMTSAADVKSLETYRSEQKPRHKMAVFITQLNDLVKKTSGEFPRIELNNKSEIILITKESVSSSHKKLEEKVKTSVPVKIINSGIGLRYLTISTQQKDKEKIQKGEAAHRQKIMNFEVEKIRITNSVSNLLELCEKASKLYQHFGEAHGALLLQKLFPSIAILISAAIRSQENIEEICEELSSANQALRTKVLEEESFIKWLKDCLQVIEKSAGAAHERNKSVLQGLINQEISLKKDLEEIACSLRDCTDLFIMSGMLKEGEEELLQKNIQNMLHQSKSAAVLDAGYAKLATSVQSHGGLTIESFHEVRPALKSSTPMLVEIKSEPRLLSEFETIFAAFKTWGLPEWKNENKEVAKRFESYIQNFGLETASPLIPVGLCTAVFDQIKKNKKFLSSTLEEFQREILEYVFNHVEELHGVRGNLYNYVLKELESNSEWINQTIWQAMVMCRPMSILIICDDRSKKIYKHPRSNQIDVFIACFKAKFYSSLSLIPGQEIHKNIKNLFQTSLVEHWNNYPDLSIQNLNLKKYNEEVKSVENTILTKKFIESLTSHWTIAYPFLQTIRLSFNSIKLGENYIPDSLCDEKEASEFFLKSRSSFLDYLEKDFKPHDLAVKLSEMTYYSISNENIIKLFLYRIVKFSQLFYIIDLQFIDWTNKALLLTMVRKEIHHTFIIAMCLNSCVRLENGKPTKCGATEFTLLMDLLTKWNNLLTKHENDLLESKQNQASEIHKINSLSPAKELAQMSITNSSQLINLKQLTQLCDDIEPQILRYDSIVELLGLIQKFFENLLSSLGNKKDFCSLQEQAQFKEKIVKICDSISKKLKSIGWDKDKDYPLSDFFEQTIKNLNVPDVNKQTLATYLADHIRLKIIPSLVCQRENCSTLFT